MKVCLAENKDKQEQVMAFMLREGKDRVNLFGYDKDGQEYSIAFIDSTGLHMMDIRHAPKQWPTSAVDKGRVLSVEWN